MFISLLLAACSPSLTCQSTNVRPRALRNDGVERVAEHAAGTPVKAADVAEVTVFLEILFYEAHVALVVQTGPDLDCLRGRTAISMFLKRRTGRWSASTCTYPPGSGAVRRRAGRVTRWSSRRRGRDNFPHSGGTG